MAQPVLIETLSAWRDLEHMMLSCRALLSLRVGAGIEVTVYTKLEIRSFLLALSILMNLDRWFEYIMFSHLIDGVKS
jgi:hypothetical protein